MTLNISNTEYTAYYRMPTKVIAQEGAVAALGPELIKAKASRVLVITDSGLASSAVLSATIDSLTNSGLKVAVRVVDEPDPTIRTIDAVGAAAAKDGYEAVVGVGGGSPLDIAKGVALVMSSGTSIATAVGVDKAAPRTVLLAAVPTTIGTGSEVSWHISVRDDVRHLKLTVRSANACPDLAILDPLAVCTLPTKIAGITAADSFTHAFESFLSNNGRWLLTDALAGGAIDAICTYLPAYLKDPTEPTTAIQVLSASCLGGITLSHARTGGVHQMARPLGAQNGVPHGLANAILLPHFIETIWDRVEDRLAELYRHVAVLDSDPVPWRAPTRARAERTKCLIVNFFDSLPIPHTLSEAGVAEPDLGSLTTDALQGRNAIVNPCIVSRPEVQAIYAACI